VAKKGKNLAAPSRTPAPQPSIDAAASRACPKVSVGGLRDNAVAKITLASPKPRSEQPPSGGASLSFGHDDSHPEWFWSSLRAARFPAARASASHIYAPRLVCP
jgi:hypothetical protein